MVVHLDACGLGMQLGIAVSVVIYPGFALGTCIVGGDSMCGLEMGVVVV